ncbi:MAG: DEAD/DEAH box helicase [Candidatus Thorarchaeota archaeon]
MEAREENYISHPLIKENLVLRRAYQEKIFINCLKHNCLVVIPTGLGKTIIALMLAVQKLSEHPDSKVIFLAPTKPLVDQHYQSFVTLTKLPAESLHAITGTTPPEKRKEIWNAVKVAFMTPQVLQNDIISQLYPINDISLIIFDECHRTVGDYAYTFIAQKYIQSVKSAQILGLTASPGSTEEKINEIKNNLYIDHVEIRTDEDKDVKPYIHNVDNEWIKIQLPSEFIEINNILIDKLRVIYRWLKKIELFGTSDINKITRKDLLSLNRKINSKISTTHNEGVKFELFKAKKLVSNAIRLSHMGELIETQGINALYDYIHKNQEKIKNNTANKSLRELYSDIDFKRLINLTETIKAKGIIHPKIEKLKLLLHSQIKEDKNSRILVFCHFRDSVNNIVKNLQDDELIKVHRFVGQQSKSSDKGLTQKEQIQLLKDFKEGTYNTLVGTSVAEEGLDIAECDLVVFYDVVPSAIRSIQRRGRTGRKKEGKVYILMAEGTRDEGYYWAEKRKESKMKESLKSIKIKEDPHKKGQVNILDFMKNKEKENLDYVNTEYIGDEDNKIESISIVCDHRETASAVVRELSLLGIKLNLEQLEVGDYIISDRVGIERKSANDFSDSIKDGRLFKELFDLKNNFERAILILEGNPFENSNLKEKALYGAITSIILNLGIIIYRTQDVTETAQFLYNLAKKEYSFSKGGPKLRFDKKPIETSHLLEYVVAGIPGINSLRAKNLLKELKTLQEIFNSDIGDLLKVDGIGKKIAREIYKISRYKYNQDS